MRINGIYRSGVGNAHASWTDLVRRLYQRRPNHPGQRIGQIWFDWNGKDCPDADDDSRAWNPGVTCQGCRPGTYTSLDESKLNNGPLWPALRTQAEYSEGLRSAITGWELSPPITGWELSPQRSSRRHHGNDRDQPWWAESQLPKFTGMGGNCCSPLG
jgi:hypothetical protein